MRVLSVLLVIALTMGVSESVSATDCCIHRTKAPPTTVEDILRDLSSRDYATCITAIRAAKGRHEPRIEDRVLEIAAGSRDANYRQLAAEALAHVDRPEAFDLLVRMAHSDAIGPREAALVALGERGDPRAFPFLLEGLSSGPEVRAYAAKGLGLLGNPDAFNPIQELFLAHHGDGAVLSLAPEALLKLDEDRAAAFLFPLAAGMRNLSSDTSRAERIHRRAIRWRLAQVLGEHDGSAIASEIVELLNSDDRDIRHAVLEGLEKSADSTIVPAVLARIDAEPDDRPLAARVLGSIRDPRTVPVLTHLLQDPSGDTRAEAAQALGSIGDRSAARALAEALAVESQPRAKILTLEALARIGERRSLTAVASRLDDPDRLAQPLAISAIWPFPWNTNVSDAAVWAFITIRDGREPFPRCEISCIAPGVEHLPSRKPAEILQARDWFRRHGDDPAFRYD